MTLHSCLFLFTRAVLDLTLLLCLHFYLTGLILTDSLLGGATPSKEDFSNS